ncbi:hypothetical protein BDR07DRAFT_1372564 [Suillus spraguei]|nr:hypothetical protein BDR07DRAFT_1372564 [Suillus spraguei]
MGRVREQAQESTSKIEELVESDGEHTQQQEKRIEETHLRNREQAARVSAGPTEYPQRVFNPAEVKKSEGPKKKDIPERKESSHTAPVSVLPTSSKASAKGRDSKRPLVIMDQEPRYNSDDNDEIMEDAPAVRAVERQREKNVGKGTPDMRSLGMPKVLAPMPQEELKHAPRVTDLSAKIDPWLLLEIILNSQIQLSAWEILAISISKDLSGSLIDLIKPKSRKDRVVAETFLMQKPKTHGNLIYIDAEINGRKDYPWIWNTTPAYVMQTVDWECYKE